MVFLWCFMVFYGVFYGDFIVVQWWFMVGLLVV